LLQCITRSFFASEAVPMIAVTQSLCKGLLGYFPESFSTAPIVTCDTENAFIMREDGCEVISSVNFVFLFIERGILILIRFFSVKLRLSLYILIISVCDKLLSD